MTRPRTWRLLALGMLVSALACTDGGSGEEGTPPPPSTTRSASPLRDRPLPPPVQIPAQSDPVALADSAFEALPGATAHHGTLGNAAFQIEVPDDWDGRLVLWMHGFEDLRAEATVGPPDVRRHLIARGIAWAASSFSSTSLVPGLAADETAALWDHFARTHGRPRWTYVAGASMGGWAAHLAAERYSDRYDGALGLCGAAGTVPGLRIGVEVAVAAAYVAGVTQAEVDAAPDLGAFFARRVWPALQDPEAHARFEDIVIDLTGGPRPFAREGLHQEEETNRQRGVLLASAGLVPPRDTPYRLGPTSTVPSGDFARAAVELPVDAAALATFTRGMETSGDLQMPLLTMHTTGDGQVPLDQARILRRRVDAAGQGERLVQRVVEDPGHCGFTTEEQEAALSALMDWVEGGERPTGTDLDVESLDALDDTFALQPRGSAPGPGSAVVQGSATVDGVAVDAPWMGAMVRDGGLLTPCQVTLPAVEAGRFEIAVHGEDELAGCGRPGTEILLWAYVGDEQRFATAPIPWPGAGVARADVVLSAPAGPARVVTELAGEVYRPDGSHAPPGTRVEAFAGDTRCATAAVRGTGSFGGYVMAVVGPTAVPGCTVGAELRFEIDGQPAVETTVNSPDRSGTFDLTLR